MNELVFLEYDFLLESGTTWNNIMEFENSLAEFFAAYGLEIENVKMVTENPEKKILFIKKAEVQDKPDTPSSELVKNNNPEVRKAWKKVTGAKVN